MTKLINVDELINSFDNSDFDNTDPADNLMNAVHIVNSMPYVEAYSKEEVIAMLKELQDELKYTNLSGLWKTNYAEGFNDSVATSVKKIQCRIDKLKENECD